MARGENFRHPGEDTVAYDCLSSLLEAQLHHGGKTAIMTVLLSSRSAAEDRRIVDVCAGARGGDGWGRPASPGVPTSDGHSAAGRKKEEEKNALGFVQSNGIELAYEAFGDPRDPPMVLIQGLGAQMVGWRAELCQALAARGHWVVRFDNRDVGLSTKLPGTTYTLADMADDTAGLIAALGHQSAHVVGQSLGGMVAQELVIRHPTRVRSLCLIYSAPNGLHFVRDPEVEAARSPDHPPRDRAEAIEQYVANERFCGSRDYPFDVEWIRELGGIMWDRGWYPEGIERQRAAIPEPPDRSPALRAVTVPTLLIHGDADRLINPTGSEALAEAMPAANLHIFPGMGHELPRPLWPELVDLITANAAEPPP